MKQLTAGLACLLALTSCSRSGADENPPHPPGVTPGGVLRIGITQPTSVDPAQAYDRDGQLVVAAMCDPLVEIHPRTGKPYAGLSRHIVPEGEGTGIMMTLEDDLVFSDGRQSVVKDVRTSLSRVASDTLASPLAKELEPVAGFAAVHGDVAVKESEEATRTILQGVTQVTSKVFTVTGVAPDAELVTRLARPWTAVLPANQSSRSDFARQPICIGPYRLAKPWSPADKTITLVRSKAHRAVNDAYTGGGKGYPDSIVFRVYASEDAAYAGWLRGEVDVARVPRAQLATTPKGGTVSTAVTPTMEYIGLPVSTPPWGGATVGAALSVALDRSAVLAKLGRRDRVAATGLLPATLVGAATEAKSCTDVVPPRGDVARARAMLAKEKVDLRGKQVKLYVNDEPGSGNREMVQAVADQWRAAFGLMPTVVPLSWSEYLVQAKKNRGFDGPFRTSWASPYASPASWIGPLFLSSKIGDTNLTRFSPPFLDRFYERMVLKETDDDNREKAERRILDDLCKYTPLVPIWSGTQSFVVRSSVGSAAGSFQRVTSGDLAVRELYVKR